MSFDKKTVILRIRENLDYLLQILAANWERQSLGGHPLAITITEETRSLASNALMWVYLTAWAEQIEWPVNGRMELITPGEWKDILTAAFLKETGRVAPGINGGMVLLGCRTRDFSGRTMRDFIAFIEAEGTARGVVFKDQVSSMTDERAAS
jgi:hypothetical protein